jgi:hypothetical protein
MVYNIISKYNNRHCYFVTSSQPNLLPHTTPRANDIGKILVGKVAPVFVIELYSKNLLREKPDQ